MLEKQGLQADNQMLSRKKQSTPVILKWLWESPEEKKTCPTEIAGLQIRKPEYAKK